MFFQEDPLNEVKDEVANNDQSEVKEELEDEDLNKSSDIEHRDEFEEVFMDDSPDEYQPNDNSDSDEDEVS